MKAIIRDMPLNSCRLLIGAIFIFMYQAAFAAEVSCGGYSTLLYSNDNVVLTICHGPYTKIDLKHLEQWQNCDDAQIQIRYKKTSNTTLYADCLSEAGKQFRILGDSFMLRHFETMYPGFEAEPLLTETLNLEAIKTTYKFEKKFPACTSKEISQAVKQVDAATDEAIDGEQNYFNLVYGGFYKLRNCASSDPELVLSILHKYQNSEIFDGEVAETLGSVTSDVELIYVATKR